MLLLYARAMWRRRWYAAIVAWLIAAAGWTFVTMLPNSYETQTRIYVDTNSMLGPLLKGIAVDYNVLSIVDLMERTLLSQPNLEKVVRMADLDASGEGTEDLIADLRRRISITGEGQEFSLQSLIRRRIKAWD